MRPEQLSGKKVLYGCLDWGSGHVARSIPLILQLQQQGNHVVFMGSSWQRDILEQYGFTGTFKELLGTGFRFKGDGNFTLEGLRNINRIRKSVQRDRDWVEAYSRTHKIDVIISDHRYGFYTSGIPSFFVTHQVQLPPATNVFARYIHKRWMSRFDTIWIMDDEQGRLAGELSVPTANSIYIGHYSRFSGVETKEIPGSVVAVISGPEPYAEQLFDQVVTAANASSGRWTIICPKEYPGAGDLAKGTILSGNWLQADAAIAEAEWIISRSGYSTLMDLKVLGKKAVLIPTPGQLEQEYLGKVNHSSLWQVCDSGDLEKLVFERNPKI